MSLPPPRSHSLLLAAAVATALASGLGAPAHVARGQGPALPRLPIVFHVVHDAEGQALISEERLVDKVREAAGAFAPAGFDFYVHDVRSLPPAYEVLETIRERRLLRRYFRPRVINAFVVRAIADRYPSAATRRAAAAQGREPSGWISGAHIPSGQGRRPDTYLLLSTRTDLWSLQHELGHFFGASHHTDPDNIMSYGRDRRVFDDEQVELFRRNGSRIVRRRLLRPILGPRADS